MRSTRHHVTNITECLFWIRYVFIPRPRAVIIKKTHFSINTDYLLIFRLTNVIFFCRVTCSAMQEQIRVQTLPHSEDMTDPDSRKLANEA